MSNDPSNSTWSFQLRPGIVPNNLDLPIYQWMPDVSAVLQLLVLHSNQFTNPFFPLFFPLQAHIAVIANKDSDGVFIEEDPYIMFWSGYRSFRSVGGPTPYPEDQRVLDPQNSVFGGSIDNADRYNNGGMWMNSVFRKSDINNNTNTNRLIGFYHAEDHYYGRSDRDGKAWKSMGMAISRDDGYTWRNQGQILSRPKPETPEWGGAADGVVIWHEPDQRWICYYATHNIAVSDDPEGRPGSK
jgi:hypothetical protein